MTSDNYIFDVDNNSKIENPPKTIYAGDIYGGQAKLTVTDTGIYLEGNKTNVINVTDKFGIHLTGNISFSANPTQIYLAGGYWTLNPLLLSCLPSTNATPIPTLVKSTPQILNSSSALKDCLSFLGENGL